MKWSHVYLFLLGLAASIGRCLAWPLDRNQPQTAPDTVRGSAPCQGPDRSVTITHMTEEPRYWIYDDPATGHVRLHLEDCRSCRHGLGKLGIPGDRSYEDHWVGPFESRDMESMVVRLQDGGPPLT